MKERRKWKRYTVSYPIEGKENRGEGFFNLVDVSKGGIAFTAIGKVCKDDKIDLRIFLKEKMFSLKALVVYVRELKENIYNIGAKFLNIPEGFHKTLEKEIEEIIQFRRECNLYNRKSLSLEKASKEYLKNTKLAHPLKTRAIAEARIKTDKIDAKTLAHLDKANLVAEAYIAPVHVRDQRLAVSQ